MLNVIWICYTNKTDIVLGFIFCGTHFKSLFYFFKEMNTFIQHWCIKLIKSDSKDIYNATKDFDWKLILLFWTFYSPKNPDKTFSCDFLKSSKTVFNNKNNRNCFLRWFLKDHVCNTEDWSNDAENSALNHSNKLHFKIYSIRNKFTKYFHNSIITVSNKCRLVRVIPNFRPVKANEWSNMK